MKRLGPNLDVLISKLSGNADQAKINYRAHQVRQRYRTALESVYKEQAALFLAHTNNVYIMVKDGVKTLIVYVDDSIFAAELNAQRELIKLKLLELTSEEVEEFLILVSRGKYKQNHPYISSQPAENQHEVTRKPLTKEQRALVRSVADRIENPHLRKKVEKAMTADLERKDAQDGKSS